MSVSAQQSARFAFPKLVVRDLARSVAFYRAVIGFGEGQAIVGAIAGRPIEEQVFFGSAGAVELIVLTYTDDGPPPEPSGVIIGFYTPDLEAFEQRVRAAGGTVVQPIGPLEMPGSAALVAFYADPEGYLLEVVEVRS